MEDELSGLMVVKLGKEMVDLRKKKMKVEEVVVMLYGGGGEMEELVMLGGWIERRKEAMERFAEDGNFVKEQEKMW